MKTILLGLAGLAFAATSASAGGCSYGMAKMSHGTKSETIAQSQPVKMPEIEQNFEIAALQDGWLVKFLDKA